MSASPLQPLTTSAKKVVFLFRQRADTTRGESGSVIVTILDAREQPATLRPHCTEA